MLSKKELASPLDSRSSSKSSSRSRSRSRSHSSKLRSNNFNNEKKLEKGTNFQKQDILSRIKRPNKSDSDSKEKFVWNKKVEQLKNREDGKQALEEEERIKQERLAKEIENIRKRKVKTEKAKKSHDEEKVIKQQIQEEEAYKKWLEKEEHFHTEQAKLRSELRIQQGREQPVDYLVKILLIQRGKFDYDPSQEREIRKPYTLLTRLTREELIQLQTDIQEKIKLELNDYYKQFWNEIVVLVEDKLHSIDTKTAKEGFPKLRVNIIGEEFEKEVNEMIGDKSYNQLIQLEKEINQTLDCPSDFKIDVEYWENVLKKLKVQKAKAFLEEMGAKFLENSKTNSLEIKKSLYSVNINSGDLSPRLLDFEKRFEALLINPAEDVEAINEERGNILVMELQKHLGKKLSATKEKLRDDLEQEEDQSLEIEEAESKVEVEGVREEQEFNEIVTVDEKHYDWMDKYVPRKPQYFNRVKVGYEWNKYNQTHYDQDNPPPKIVQGYKFNVFYPDLIDNTKAPEFHLEPTDNPDYCNIRFHAGPPYEDIAFKIWNREWDFSDKQGFKCIFENNILHLYFNFRKSRYRR